MSIDSIYSRLQRINQELVTYSSFEKIKNMSGKKRKPCKCSSHGSTPRCRCPRKSSSHIGRDRCVHCSHRQRPQICMCDRAADDKTVIEPRKTSTADDDVRSQSDYSTQPEQLREEATEPFESTNPDHRIGHQLTSGVESNASVARNAANFEMENGDGEIDRASKSKRSTAASQTLNIVDHRETPDADERNDDRMDYEQMYKELAATKKLNRELEDKLKSMSCSMQCMKSEGDQQAACLMDALEKAKEQAQLASRSKSIALDLAKQSRDRTDLVRASRDELLNQYEAMKCNNTKLQCECDELRGKLVEVTEMEVKKCAEVDDKVNRMKCAVKQKEMALACEKKELEKTVADLTKHIKIQKKRLNELTLVCTKQRNTMQEHEDCIATKLAQLSEAENKIQSMNCRCGGMDDAMEELKCRLKEEIEARCGLQKASDDRQDNCNCELQIKAKIIADQLETIKKLKKCLQDSDRMAHQAAREFESLRDEFHGLKQQNKSLRRALEEAEAEASVECENECCERCSILETQLCAVSQQKHKALLAAKCAAEKLLDTKMEYQRQLDCEKQRHRFLTDALQKRDTEIELLKNEILHVKQFRDRRSNDFIVQ